MLQRTLSVSVTHACTHRNLDPGRHKYHVAQHWHTRGLKYFTPTHTSIRLAETSKFSDTWDLVFRGIKRGPRSKDTRLCLRTVERATFFAAPRCREAPRRASRCVFGAGNSTAVLLWLGCSCVRGPLFVEHCGHVGASLLPFTEIRLLVRDGSWAPTCTRQVIVCDGGVSG